MAAFAESLFPILDYLAQQLTYICWISATVAFITLCTSSDIDRQYTRMARISSIATPCLFVFYCFYILSSTTVSLVSIVSSFSPVSSLLTFNMNPFFWLIYGGDAISADLNFFLSVRQEIETRYTNKYLHILLYRAFDLANILVYFGGWLCIMFPVNLSDVRQPVMDDTSLFSAATMSFICVASLGYVAHSRNKELKKKMAEERVSIFSTEEAAAEFADEKVAKQDPNTA